MVVSGFVRPREAPLGPDPAAPERDGVSVVGAGSPPRMALTLAVNGQSHALWVEPRRTLLEMLRMDLGLTGAKPGCERGDCGACTVLRDGRAVYACLALALACEGCEVTTVEGLGQGGALDPIQEAFVTHDAFQCGFCTPGQVMAAKALLLQDPAPALPAVREALAGNLCRCGAYQRIVQATLAAARGARPGGDGRPALPLAEA